MWSARIQSTPAKLHLALAFSGSSSIALRYMPSASSNPSGLRKSVSTSKPPERISPRLKCAAAFAGSASIVARFAASVATMASFRRSATTGAWGTSLALHPSMYTPTKPVPLGSVASGSAPASRSITIVSWSPPAAAHCSASISSSSVLTGVRFAIASSSTLTVLLKPLRAAIMRAVRPWLLAASVLTSAPSKSETMDAWPSPSPLPAAISMARSPRFALASKKNADSCFSRPDISISVIGALISTMPSARAALMLAESPIIQN
mmetsp:Transcript_101247/g.290501  ORF Transcript_101247/g.290501 Transcript_101247/m.290501 type:complete len:264 (-) Transcript_101247:358-1149(-)